MAKKIICILVLCMIFLLSACSKKEEHSVKETATDTTTATASKPSSEMSITYSDSTKEASKSLESELTFSGTADVAITDSSMIKDVSPNLQSGQLTAGEWNDNENWDFWNNLLNTQEYSTYMTTWQMNTQGRTAIYLTSNQQPVPGINVTLKDIQGNVVWQSITDHLGTAYLFNTGNDQAQTIEISYLNQVLKSLDYDASLHEISLDLDKVHLADRKAVDILFLIDTTGSMTDELSYLQAELKSVITSVAEENMDLKINISANYYRDEGDDYVIKSYPFTNSLNTVTDQISQQYANGGGDFPEAVDRALSSAIFEHSWSDQASAKLLFLVLDAPPHNTPEVIENLHKCILAAAEKGIKIIPITSSGIDKETEILLRSFAIETNGTYTFLTNDSGIGDSHLEPTIGDYSVEYLNDLLIRLIKEYTSHALL